MPPTARASGQRPFGLEIGRPLARRPGPALGAILASDGWRTALLAALVLGGVLLTRVRFAPHAAVVLAAGIR